MPPVARTTAFAAIKPEAASLAVVSESSHDAARHLEQGEHGALHVNIHPRWMPWSCKVRIISRPVRSPTWARRGYLWPPKFRCRILPSAVRSNSAPHASSSRTHAGASLACSSRHAPVVQILAAAHGVGEMNPPVVALVHIGQCRRDAAFRHDGMRFAEQRFAHYAHFDARGGGFNGGAQACSARTNHQHIVGEPLEFRHQRILQSCQIPIEQRRT